MKNRKNNQDKSNSEVKITEEFQTEFQNKSEKESRDDFKNRVSDCDKNCSTGE